jgi:hypothetical protein
MKEAWPASPLLVPVEVVPTLRFSPLLDCNLSFQPKGHFVRF